ncbi:MAG: Hint domain-containing protein [Brevirhabdus sp.]
MITGSSGTFVIRWQQTEIDGVENPAPEAVREGATWRWNGQAVRVDGPDHILLTGDADERLHLRRRVSRSLKRLLAAELDVAVPADVPVEGEPIFDEGFVVTDGRASYAAAIVAMRRGKAPLVMFSGRLPVCGTDLWVVRTIDKEGPVIRNAEFGTGVICFTEHTMIDTPDGARPVQDIHEGDWVLTKDNGSQQVTWRGARRMSGARLFAMPELRPVRIRAGAFEAGRPDRDLVVSPKHRLLVQGAMAQSLFNTDEVMVAAEHLINDHSILVDYNLTSTTYHHLMLEDHQVLFANGVETESFHPASTTLDTLEAGDRERLVGLLPEVEFRPEAYGDYVRRDLSRSEAAILHHALNRTH